MSTFNAGSFVNKNNKIPYIFKYADMELKQFFLTFFYLGEEFDE